MWPTGLDSAVSGKDAGFYQVTGQLPAGDVEEPSAPATPAESTIAVASAKAMNLRMVMFSFPL